MACVSSAFSPVGCGVQVLPATTAAGVAFSETNKGYSELKQMYQAFCFNHPGLYDRYVITMNSWGSECLQNLGFLANVMNCMQ